MFLEEGTGDIGDDDKGNDVVNNDNDGSADANFDKVDVADMLEDVLACGKDSDDESDNYEMLWGD